MNVSQSEKKFKNFESFFNVQSQKPSSVMLKLALMRTTTGKEDPELPLLQRISSLELPASEIAAQINGCDGRKLRMDQQHCSYFTILT